MATDRLSEMAGGRLLYELRHRWRDGTTHVAFEPLELIDRLAALVPPPRFHTVRYHGVLASRSRHRADIVPDASATGPAVPSATDAQRPTCVHRPIRTVVPGSRPPDRAGAGAGREPDPTPVASRSAGTTTPSSSAQDVERVCRSRTTRPSRYHSWSELMRRVFEIDVLLCPRCEATPMRILAAIHPPTTTQAILRSLGLPTRAPPVAPARPVSPDWTLSEPVVGLAGYFTRPAA